MRENRFIIWLLTIMNNPVARVVYVLAAMAALIIGGGAPEIFAGH